MTTLQRNFDRPARRRSSTISLRNGFLALAVAGALSGALSLGGCAGAPPAVDDENPVIEPLPGMNYFIGGAVMTQDSTGRTRIRDYQGRVLLPPSRGAVVGFKENPGGTWERMEYLNGHLLVRSRGNREESGVLRELQREEIEGGVMARRYTWAYYDDRREIDRTTTTFGPDGKVLSSKDETFPYPEKLKIGDDPEFDEFFADFDEEEEAEAGEAAEEGQEAAPAAGQAPAESPQ